MEPFFQVTSAEIWRLKLAPIVLLFCRKMFYHITWLVQGLSNLNTTFDHFLVAKAIAIVTPHALLLPELTFFLG